MNRHTTYRALVVALGVACAAGPPSLAARQQAQGPENLATKAAVKASSHYSDDYLPRFAVDGKVPPAGSQGADRGKAWCVRKEVCGDRGDFTLEWKEPVDIAEIIYYGRTAWYLNECWKDFEVVVNDDSEPALRGTLKMKHGPQRIRLARRGVRRIVLRFINSYGGFNPGASEIQVFARSPSDAFLRQFARKGSTLAPVPGVEGTDTAALGRLIRELSRLHGAAYRRSAEHLRRLQALERGPDSPETSEALEDLEREVLLFDVDKLLVIERHEIMASHVYTYHYEGFKPGGSLQIISARDPEAAPRELVASPEGQILDADLSHDAKTILFSWRRRENEGYHLWTIQTDGSDLRQLTEGEWHDYNACWLPDGDIAFLSTRAPQFAYCWHAPVGILHRMNADGSGVQRLSANYLNDFTPRVLEDGRILYSRWEYVDRPAIPIQSLWTINPDGTGLSGYFGNRVLSPGTFMEARQIPGTTRIICTMTGHNGPTRGAIGVVDRALGDNAQEAIENITPDVPLPRVDEGNGNTSGTKQYSCPVPLDSLRFLVSARGPVLVRTIAGNCQSVALDAPLSGMQYFSAQPVRPRPRPPVIPSRPPAIAGDYAAVYLQDVYDGLGDEVQRGEVKAIRVVRELEKTVRIDPSLRAFGFQFPVISCGATYAGKEVLGEVPVEPDGSAYFLVPAGIPVYFMALDASGKAVQRMRSFTHFMKGEVQGCIGCHESRRQAPGTRLQSAYGEEPRHLEPPEWGRGGFDYSRIVQPVLDKYCVSCHNAVTPPKGIDLTGGKTDYFSVSYDVLARENQGRRGTRFVNWIPTYNGQEWNILEVRPKTWGSPRSLLATLLFSGHPGEDGKPRFQMDDTSRRRILAWIDLNVPYYGTSETAYPEKRGCRQLQPKELDRVLAGVERRRCAGCHKDGKIPRHIWTRITDPQLNNFLLAPLAEDAGGSGRCGKPVFKSTADPDYQAILATFRPVEQMLAKRPRMDMPTAVPAAGVNRSCR